MNWVLHALLLSAVCACNCGTGDSARREQPSDPPDDHPTDLRVVEKTPLEQMAEESETLTLDSLSEDSAKHSTSAPNERRPGKVIPTDEKERIVRETNLAVRSCANQNRGVWTASAVVGMDIQIGGGAPIEVAVVSEAPDHTRKRTTSGILVECVMREIASVSGQTSKRVRFHLPMSHGGP